jgi:hypothetical protein
LEIGELLDEIHNIAQVDLLAIVVGKRHDRASCIFSRGGHIFTHTPSRRNHHIVTNFHVTDDPRLPTHNHMTSR